MIKKIIHAGIKFLLIGVTALVGFVFPCTADADSYFSGVVKLPYEVQWGLAVIQPGDYRIRIGSLSQPAQIYAMSGKQMFFTSAQFTSLNRKGKTCLIVTPDGSKHVVNSLNMPFFGISLIYKPLTKIQRENIAKSILMPDQIAITESK